MQVSVYRYNPDQDEKPFMQDFQVNTECKDLMVLDVLALIKEQESFDIPIRVIWENVASMTVAMRDKITLELREVDPHIEMVCIDGGATTWCARKRLWWTNFYIPSWILY